MIYQVLLDGKVVFEGTRTEICLRYNVDKSSVAKCISQKIRLLRLYNIVEKEENYINSKLKYLIDHLTKYGNTCLSKDPTPYIKDLREHGIEIKFRKVKSDTGIGRRKSYFYIIERVGG